VLADTRVDASLLGEMDGIVAFCSIASPASAHAYRELSEQITNGLGTDVLEDARERPAYRDAFKDIISILERSIPPDQRSQACVRVVGPAK
jgi:hypothetical protein